MNDELILPDSWRADCHTVLLCDDQHEVFAKTARLIEALGFDMAGMGMALRYDPSRFVDHNTLPAAWNEIRGWPDDPPFRHYLQRDDPMIVPHIDQAPRADRAYWDACHAVGIRHGIVSNVKTSESICLVAAMRGAEPITPHERAHVEPRLEYLSNVVATALTPVLLPDLLLPSGARLTVRQREILRFAADGRSAKEVSKALNISEDTVRLHLRDARDRLGARTMTHAVSLALRCRLI
jgi:LuxR family transcriptional regulator